MLLQPSANTVEQRTHTGAGERVLSDGSELAERI